MIEVGIRELKGRLSYYVRLMQAGETIAIKARDHVVGFLDRLKPAERGEKPRRRSRRNIGRLIETWKKKGLVLSGGPYRHIPFKPVRLKGGLTASQMIRQMRDEDE